ncbi:MAG: hypothetical protein AAB481_02275 [Patescibacteria group bacterium]
MRIRPALGSVVGVSGDTHWGQVFLSPTAYGVVEVEDPDGRARDWGVKVLSSLSEQVADPPKSLKSSQEIAIRAMEERVTSLILLVPVGAVLYVILLGDGKVLLKRGNTLATLIDKPGAISGEVQGEDTLILMSRSVAGALLHEEVNTLFDHLDAPGVAEKMTLMLHKHEDGASGAALIFQAKGLIPVEEEELISQTRAEISPSHLPISRRDRIFHAILHVRGLSSRPMLPITAILVLLFVVSVVIGIRKEWGKKRNTDIARVLTVAQHAFEEGVALLPLNSVKGRERLTFARDQLSPLIAGISPSSTEGKAVLQLFKDVVIQLTIASQVYRVEAELYYDLSLLKSGATIGAIGQDDDTVGLLDVGGPTVVVFTLSSKNAQVTAGGEGYRGARLITIHGGSMYVLVENGIHKTTVLEKKTTQNIIKRDSEWGEIRSMEYYGGNLYLLDITKSRIWKYVATEKGFSEIREYLNPDTLPDLSLGTGMVIDGGVWVGTKDGRILRFLQGKEQTFVPQGVIPMLGKSLSVTTTEENKNLYVLDSDNNRVVVMDKEGIYLSQYGWKEPFTPTQILVSEKMKKIFFLASGKLYSVDLK